ncbi:helix-turn-helix domain-containing protein [Virgibacillus siamensis]|uniref:helix-turn-helix domain-containing protein n=1 Tax=Virgibacillus siamensis TaxID=480071 RepID=UPI000984BF0F|nr:helix-turn-helix domain-containing protein [Virgibacillus siamensis]
MNHYLKPHIAAKLLKLNKLLTQSLKLEEVLQNVVASASELVKVADTIIIYLFDETEEKLKFAEGEGVDSKVLQQIAFSPGESIAGKIFQEREAKLFVSEEEIDSFMNNMSQENYPHYFQGIYRRKIKSAFCVPIVNKDRCLGVLVVDNFKQDGIFTESDMQVIQVLAEQSAIAIDNSNVYQSLKKTNNLLKQAAEMHHRYYQLIIEGGGIDRIVSMLKRFINSDVIFDSTDIYEEDDNKIFPIVRGKEVLGILQLAKPFSDFTAIEQAAIEQASLVIAIELMKDHALMVKELQFREEVFNQLMEGIPNHDLGRILQYFEWDEYSDVQCMVMEGSNNPLWKQDRLKDKERLVRSIEEALTAVCGKSLVITRAFQIITVFPANNDKITGNAITNIKANSGTKQLLFGVGRRTSISKIATSHGEAVRSLSYAKVSPDKNIVEYAKLGMERLLHEIDSSIVIMYIQDKLGDLLSAEKDLLETLQTFIKCNKNHKDTAANLHIHVNTLYYRLRRIEKLLDIDMNNQKEWLDLVVALQLYVASNNY